MKIFKINNTRDLQATVEKALKEVGYDKSFALQWPNGNRLIFNGMVSLEEKKDALKIKRIKKREFL